MGKKITAGHTEEAALGIQERKDREKAERKALITGCAKELIMEHGAEAVSMADIAQKTELSKATLYLYFPSKEVLFKEILRESTDRFIQYVRSRLNPAASALDALKTLWTSYVTLFGESEDIIVIMYIWNYLAPAFPFLSLEEPPLTDEASANIYFLLKELTEQGIAEGFFDPSINTGTISHVIITIFSYIVDNSAKIRRDSKTVLPVIGEMKNIFEIILRGIAKEGIPRSLFSLPDKAEP
ncbi:MAG: TetR/AcrR family transcriptional regulator [Spirochaetaceae bacterium]|jgi:AcrR family transcriptional regulator|nr:TetR/AcrR family transcriptional regulator [Spirochaetaceae bacterium]